jgi:TRAP-type C4-dicarboxylate transport system permease large subunit
MGIRAVTGYIAHVALVVYWAWVVISTAPQLRKGTRDRRVRARALAIKSAAFLLTAVVVGVIHYWATAWWQVIVAVPVAAVLGVLLHREYRRTVAAPRHRLPLSRRARAFDLRRRPRGSAPLHLRVDELGAARIAD